MTPTIKMVFSLGLAVFVAACGRPFKRFEGRGSQHRERNYGIDA